MPRPDPHDARRALTAIRAGAEDYEAAAFVGVDEATFAGWLEGEFGAEVREARNELVIWARSQVRTAAGQRPDLAREFIDREAGRRNISRLRSITHPA